MSSSLVGKKNNEAFEALSDVSRLLSRLAKSRKAPSQVNDVINLTREVARLSRSLNQHGSGDDNDGYGDPGHYGKISKPSKNHSLIR